jgi:predicted ATPase
VLDSTGRSSRAERGAALLSINRARGSAGPGPVAQRPATSDPPALLQRRRPPGGAFDALPAPPTSFIGREHDVVKVGRLLRASRLVTLVGAGGVGKTRLALHVANGQRSAFRDGITLVALGTVAEPSLVVRALASALQHRDEGAASPAGTTDRLLETLAAAIGIRECLLVLDNCEHLLDTVAALVDHLIRLCPRLCILTTSREPIAVDGEAIWRVSPLALTDPDAADVRAGSLSREGLSEAAQLFLDRARAASPRFAMTPESSAAVELICRRLDGIPLAIELAAARLRGLPLGAIADGLDDLYSLLTSGSRVAPARHRTLRALVDWSFELLTGEERALFRRLAVFASSFSLAAAEAVGQIEGRGLDLLPRLVEKSLVVLDQQDGQPRFRLLDTLREYASEKLRDAGEEEATRQRYVHWYCRLAELGDARLRTAEHDTWIARLAQEHDNLRRAIGWSLAEPHDDAGPRMVGALNWFWEIRGHHVEAAGYLDRALAVADDRAATTSPNVRAKLLNGLGLFSYACGSYRAAVA